MKIKISKVRTINPATKKVGVSARVITNGTADFSEIAEEAGTNTTVNPIEIEASAKLFCQAAAKELKKGMIVDLGPLGKLYPSCTSGWVEKAEDLTMDSVKAHVNYSPSDDIKAAIQGASMSWMKAQDNEAEAVINPAASSGSNGSSSSIAGDLN